MSGRKISRYLRRALGMPFIRHSDTDDGFISHNMATADVPPNSSIILESFMERILGIPKLNCQGIPNKFDVRLTYMKTWNERLKAARAESGCTQTELAREVGVSNATVSDWESGEIKNLEGENLLRICEFFRISPTWLQFGRGEKSFSELTADDLRALEINRLLGSKEKRAWYRAGDSLAEPDEGTNGKQ